MNLFLGTDLKYFIDQTKTGETGNNTEGSNDQGDYL